MGSIQHRNERAVTAVNGLERVLLLAVADNALR
jgi:hypothetical protein